MLNLIRDLPWWFWVSHLLLLPLYVIIGTAKHELSHALAALWAGYVVMTIKVLPSWIDGKFYMGYTAWLSDERPVPRYVYMLPYYVDVPIWAFGMWLLFNSGVDWLSCAPLVFGYSMSVILGLLVLSPALDIAYNTYKWLVQGRGDFAKVANK